MKELELILSLAGTVLGLVVTALTFFVKLVKNGRAKKAAEQVLQIANTLLPYIEQAETFVNYTGQEKKQFVMTKANQYAIENGIVFDPEAVSSKVEQLVLLTKSVNIKTNAATNPAAQQRWI